MARFNRFFALPAIVACAFATGGSAGAQTLAQFNARAHGTVAEGAASSSQQTTKSFTEAPVAHLFGMPVVISSPLDASYNAAAAYSTYEGQPGFGPNAVLANGNAGAPE